MLLRRLMVSMAGLLLAGWLVGIPAGAAQEKGDPEPKEGELAPTEKLGKLTLTLDPGWHTNLVRKAFFTPDGRQVITLGEDQAIRIWDAASGEMHKVLYPPGQGGLFHADLSGDGKRLVVASHYLEGDKLSNVVYVLALPEGRVERVLRGTESKIQAVSISRDGKQVAASSGGPTLIWNLDLNKDEPTSVLRKNFTTIRLALSPDGKRIACCKHSHDGQLIEVASGKELARLHGHTAAWSPDGKTLATTVRNKDDKGYDIHLLDADGKLIRVCTSTSIIPHRSLAFSADSRTLLATTVLFDVASGAELSKVQGNIQGKKGGPGDFAAYGWAEALSPDGRFAVMAGLQALVWNTTNGAIVKKLATPTWIHHNFCDAAWSPNGVSWNTWRKSPSFHLGDLRFGPHLADKGGALLRQGPWALEWVRPWDIRVLKDGKPTSVLKGRHPTLLDKDQFVALTYPGPSLRLFDAGSGKELRRFEVGQSSIDAIAPSPDGRLFMTVSEDATQRLSIWNPEQEKPLLHMYSLDNDWILWTPEGYYAATPGGERLMGWLADNGPGQMATFYSAERFRKQMYRPDVIKLLLVKGNLKDALAAANAALKQPGTRGVEIADLNKQLPPQATLRILDTKDLPRVKVKASAAQAVKEQPVTGLRLLVDGRPLADEASVRYATPKDKAEIEWTITLAPGKHQLVVLARSEDSSSKSNAVEVTVGDPTKQNTLHVLAIGVNDYEDATLKLDFAAKDAQDIAANFPKCCKGELFHDVRSEALVNAGANKQAILKHLVALRKQVKPNDLAVIFFAGHGVKEKDKFYLLPVEAKTDNLGRTAISAEELRKSLGEFPCQVLLMLDACHSSGGVKNFRPAVDDITRNLTDDDCGVAVMCAAMAHEKALEKGGNGLFTRAVVKALNRAEGVSYNPRSRLFFVHHLHSYVFDDVSDQSGGRQHPFLSLPWVVESFPVAQFTTK